MVSRKDRRDFVILFVWLMAVLGFYICLMVTGLR